VYFKESSVFTCYILLKRWQFMVIYLPSFRVQYMQGLNSCVQYSNKLFNVNGVG